MSGGNTIETAHEFRPERALDVNSHLTNLGGHTAESAIVDFEPARLSLNGSDGPLHCLIALSHPVRVQKTIDFLLHAY
jgi:hypothetical protein